MKRNVKSNILKIMMLFFIFGMGLMLLVGCKNNKNYKEYYKVTYSSSYNKLNLIFKTGDYEVITDKVRLTEFANEISDVEEIKIFDDKFFKNKNVLVVNGSVDSKVNNFDITEKKANVIIYCGAPLVSYDELLDFDIYFIPIDKNVSDINVETLVYPDRDY